MHIVEKMIYQKILEIDSKNKTQEKIMVARSLTVEEGSYKYRRGKTGMNTLALDWNWTIKTHGF